MDQSELRKFILDYCDGKIFTDQQAPIEHISMIFMILIFMKPEEYDLPTIGCMWEYISEAGPRSINGYPIFMSAHFMHKDDWKICVPAIERELKRRKDLPILVPEEPTATKQPEQPTLFEGEKSCTPASSHPKS
jgi:hypothetical protein